MMQIVKKFKKGEKIQVLETLSEEMVNALFYVFVKNTGDYYQREIVSRLVEKIRENAWIACDCHTESLPLMAIGRSSKDNYYLKRIIKRGKHHSECFFKEVDYLHISGNNYIKPYTENIAFKLHSRGRIAVSDKKNETVSHAGPSIRYPKLARVLYTMISAAKLNQLFIGEGTIDRFHALHEVAKKFSLETGVNAADFFHTYPDVARMVKNLKQKEKMWSKKMRPHAICITVANKIEENHLFFIRNNKMSEVVLNGEVKKSSGRIGANSGPFLVIFTVTDTLDNIGNYKPMNAFYVPVYNVSQFVPVDSTYERDVLEAIEKLCYWCLNKNKAKDLPLKVTVTKPLFDIEKLCEGKLESSKPDFLIETPNNNIVFEVMGSHEEDYLERKKRTTKFMKALGEFIEFDALYAKEKDCWEMNLKDTMRVLASHIFRGNVLP